MKPCALISPTQSSSLLSHLLEESRRERICLPRRANTACSESVNIRRCGTNREVVAKSSEKAGLRYHTLNSGLCSHMAGSHALGLVASEICVTDRVQTHNSRLNIGLLFFLLSRTLKAWKVLPPKKRNKYWAFILKRGSPTCVRHL